MSLNKARKIFIVEDNPMYQQLVVKALSPLSNDIHLFTSGEDCLKEMGQEPCVIIMDYMLEGKMNGLATIRKIRAMNESVYVILFSTDSGLLTEENIQQYGVFEYLKKSISAFPVLRQMITSSLSQLVL